MLFTDPDPILFDEDIAPEVAQSVPPETARRSARLAAFASTELSAEAGNILNSMVEKTDAYEARINAEGEASVRLEAASRAQENRLAALGSVLTDTMPSADPELAQGSALAYTRLSAMDAAEEAAYALEQQAVENIQNLAAAGNITQARVMLSNLENGNALDVIRDMNAKSLILQNMIERAQIAQQDQPWFRDLADFVLQAVPLYSPSRTGNVPIEEGVANWYDSLFAGERFKNEADSLWDMPIAEFSKFVNEDFAKNLYENATLLGYTNNSEMLDLLTGLGDRTPSATETNAWSAVDLAGAPGWGLLSKAGRGGLGLVGSMVRNGARREAAEYTAAHAMNVVNDSAATAARVTGLADREVENALSVAAVAPEASDIRVSVAMTADAALERGRTLLASLPEIERQARMGGQEIQQALATVQQRLERQFGRDIKDVNVVELDLTGGSAVRRVEFTLGKKNGDGFATEVQANRYLSSIGEPGRAVVDNSGQWFARVAIDLPETGFYSNLLNVRTPTPARFVLNARNVGDLSLADAAQVAGNIRNKLLKTLVAPYSDTFRALRGGEKDALAQVLQAGESLGTWFSKDQIDTLYQRRFNRLPSERELAGYQAARDINDIEFALRNDDIYKQRVIKGYRTVSFDTGLGRVDRANAIIDRELKDIPRTRVYDASRRMHYADGVPPKVWERLKGQGYSMITLEEALPMADGTTIKSFLVRDKDALFENLRRDQVAYRPGGHRMYRGKYFVKQTVRRAQGDTGKEFLDNPNTYIAAETRAEAKFWSDRMEAARQALINGEDLSVIDEILGGHAGLPDVEEFVRIMNDPNGAFQRDTKFDVYYDREMPDEYLSDGQALEFVDPDDSGFNGFLRTNGRMYTGRKGEQLPDYMGNMAPLLDPYETINKSLMNIASLTSFSDYKIQAVERWMKTFGKATLDVNNIPEGWSDMRLFMEAPFKTGGNATTNRIIEAAKAQRQIIKRTLGWKTENDLRAEAFSRHLADWVAGERVDGVIPEARKAVANWWVDTKPLSALRSFAFDLKLGLFNVAQLPMQLSTAAAATALSPKNGMRGWAMIAPMRFMLGGKALTKEAFEARLDQLVKNGVHELGGFENARDFKEFTRSATRSGFFDLGGAHGLMDHYGPSATLDGFSSGVKRVREAGRFFFFEAERWNRIVAWRIAWDEVKESGLKVGSPEFAAKLAGRAEEYSFNMSRESQAWWQKGLLSIPTQFWAYNARMLEAMTVGNFTPAQKRRLIASQSLLYGSAGLPITGAISEFMKTREGGAPDLQRNPMENLWATADRGLIDQAIMSFTGADVLVGARYGTGNWAVDMTKNIFGLSSYGEVSAAELLGGATFNIMGKVVGDTLRLAAAYAAAESGDTANPMEREALIRLASNVSTLGNGIKAWMVYNYGTYLSGSGVTLVDNLPARDAFAVALGIKPAEADEISYMMGHLKDKDKAAKEAAKVFNNMRTNMLNRPDQAETIAQEANVFARLLPEDVRRDALRQAHDNVDPSLYASLLERMEREKLEEAANGQTD